MRNAGWSRTLFRSLSRPFGRIPAVRRGILPRCERSRRRGFPALERVKKEEEKPGQSAAIGRGQEVEVSLVAGPTVPNRVAVASTSLQLP